jgi:hypothetical protein
MINYINKTTKQSFYALIIAVALPRKLIYLLVNKTPISPSSLLPNPKSAASVPSNQ